MVIIGNVGYDWHIYELAATTQKRNFRMIEGLWKSNSMKEFINMSAQCAAAVKRQIKC